MTLKPGWATDETVSKQHQTSWGGEEGGREGKRVAVWRPTQLGANPWFLAQHLVP